MRYTCYSCNNKISKYMLYVYTCRCKNLYCSKHMTTHDCMFDYKKLNKIYDKVYESKNLVKLE